jgi:hypothetical protein
VPPLFDLVEHVAEVERARRGVLSGEGEELGDGAVEAVDLLQRLCDGGVSICGGVEGGCFEADLHGGQWCAQLM